MNAMARDLPGDAVDDTIVHTPATAAVPDGPAGADNMPDNTAQGQNRFIFSSGARPLEGYTIKRAVGRGGFGEVYYATSDAGKEVALKLLTRNIEIERRGVMQCMNLKSPNLITIYDLKSNEAGDTFVIMEYVAGPSLANILAQHPAGLPINEVRTWLKGLVEGVAYLHDHGIVHRDLKPANLFMEQGVVKIGDYGLSKLITQSQRTGHSESIGTCHYMAPEISTGKYHKPIDIYAMGVILFEMLTGRVPFDGETVGEVLMKHLTARADLSVLQEPYRSIVGKALAKEPSQRPGRAYDLLPSEDAPKAPKVRFIGEKNSAPAAPEKEKAGEEEVLRIGAEDPVYYIGPETRPPAQRNTFNQRFWGVSPLFDRARNRMRASRAMAMAAVRPPVPARRPAPPPPPAPIPPPSLPSARVRVAETAGSMLWAAPLAALFAFPASGLIGIDITGDPRQLAYFFLLTLLGTWGVLIPNKLWEGKSVDTTTRRVVFLAIGLLVGTLGLLLGEWTHIHLNPAMNFESPAADLIGLPGPVNQPALLGYMTFFGLVFGANGWWKLTARSRRSRFRFIPIIKAGLTALVLGFFWPFREPHGLVLVALVVVALVALVTQLVSPWSESAAAYARAARRRSA